MQKVNVATFFTSNVMVGCGETGSSSDESPWHVAVYKSGELSCGATIICHKYVMTLASCTKDSTPSDVEVRAGLTSSGSFESKYQVKTILRHPLYDAATGSYDFSLLEVNYQQPFNINHYLLGNRHTRGSARTCKCYRVVPRVS